MASPANTLAIPNWGLMVTGGALSTSLRGGRWAADASVGGVYLFEAPPGVDIFRTALGVARFAVCVGTKDASCTCRNCREGLSNCQDAKVAALNQHGNLLSSNFEGLERFFAGHPVTGSTRRVLAAESVDMATPATVASLLKVLEGGVRPPDMAIFTTNRIGGIPGTLLSRMEIVRFRGRSQEELGESLGTSLSDRDLSRSARWLSGSDIGAYRTVRRSLPSLIKGIQTGENTAAWKAVSQLVADANSCRMLIEVTHLGFADMLAFCQGSEGHPPASTALSSLKEEASAYALVWGESSLASLVDDLRNMLTTPKMRDLRPTFYRWVLKACALAKDKVFVKPEAPLLTAHKGPANRLLGLEEQEDQLVVPEDDQ